MRRLINKLTGGDMWVDESRVDEYLAAGHRLAAAPAPEKKTPIMNEPEAKEVEDQEEQAEKPVKKSAAKSRKR